MDDIRSSCVLAVNLKDMPSSSDQHPKALGVDGLCSDSCSDNVAAGGSKQNISHDDACEIHTNQIKEARRCASEVQDHLDVLQNHINGDESMVGQMLVTEDFVAAYLNEIGGILAIPETNISLFIPPGAILQSQIIYIYKLPSTVSSGPELKETETILTPLVECGTNGSTKFHKNVVLTMPHAAYSDKFKYKVHWATHDQENECWHQDQDGDMFVKKVNGVVAISTNHFTRYGVSGDAEEDGGTENEDEMNPREVRSKWMKPVMCVCPIRGKPNQYEVRVQVCNIEDTQTLPVPVSANHSSTLRIRHNGEDVKVSLSTKNSDDIMILDPESVKAIPFENLWSQYMKQRAIGGPLVIFKVRTSNNPSSSENAPSCFLTVSQGNGLETTVSIKVQAAPVTEDEREPNQVEDQQQARDREDRLLLRQPYYDATDKTTLDFINDTRFRKICVILDGMNSIELGLGWEALASNLGFKGTYSIIAIKNIASGQKKSPSVLVLDDFFKDNKDTDILVTLKILSNALGEMENHDAKDLVEEEITQRKEEIKPLIQESLKTSDVDVQEKLCKVSETRIEIPQQMMEGCGEVAGSSLREDDVIDGDLMIGRDLQMKISRLRRLSDQRRLSELGTDDEDPEKPERRKKRFSALAYKINHWEDDINHPIHVRIEEIAKLGGSMMPDVTEETMGKSDATGVVGKTENCCRICMDAIIDCVLLDCGHMVACRQCGRRLTECPMCRTTIAKVVNVFN